MNGLAVTRPAANAKNPHKRNFSLTGRGSIASGGSGQQRENTGRLGTTSVGRRQMLQSSSGSLPRSQRRNLAGLQKKGK
jgi:hypothetical protein